MNPDRIIIRTYSKIIFTYPTLLASILGWILQATFHLQMTWLEVLWTVTFFWNLFVVAFDFTPKGFIILMFVCFIAGIILYFSVIPFVGTFISPSFHLALGFTSHFYIIMTFIYLFLLIIALIKPLFNYYVVERNELYHHKGIFTTSNRYPTQNLRYSKEIPDIFEFVLLRAGRLCFYVSTNEALVLDTVLRINKKQERIEELLSKIEVDTK